MVAINKVEQGIAAYLDKEFMPQLPSNGLERVVVGTVVSIMIKRSSGVIASYRNHPLVKMLGIINEDDQVDIEIVMEELSKNIPADGLKVEIPVLGVLTFRKSDVDKLYDYIVKQVAE